ncbi:hypothetical protein A4U94_03665 [Prescottella equi]|nr:hypothetical protein A4U94_03665 [Prescottella equi]
MALDHSGTLTRVARHAEDAEWPVRCSAGSDGGEVVGGEAVTGVGGDLVAGAPVAVLFAVGVDDLCATFTFGRGAGDFCRGGGALVCVAGALVFGAAVALSDDDGAAGFGAYAGGGSGHGVLL